MPWGSLTQFNQTFTYDHVNRLTGASEMGGWSQTYSYDAWGNMTMAGNLVSPYVPTAFNGNNRVSGGGYDNAGNQLSLGPYTLTYDAENRQLSGDEHDWEP